MMYRFYLFLRIVSGILELFRQCGIFFSILFFIIHMMAQQCFHVTDDPYINDSPLHGMALLNVRVPVFINL